MHAGRSNRPKMHGVSELTWLDYPHSIKTKKSFLEVNDLVRQLGLCTCLALQGKSSIFD
jgi:hypothetical protein